MSTVHPYKSLFANEDLSRTTQEIKSKILNSLDSLSSEDVLLDDSEIIEKVLGEHLIYRPRIDWDNPNRSEPFIIQEEAMQFNRRVFREKQAINIRWNINGSTDLFNKSASTSYVGGTSHRCHISQSDGTLELSVVSEALTGDVVRSAIASFRSPIEENLNWVDNDLSQIASSIRNTAPQRIAKRRATLTSFEALKKDLDG